jgi:hypothetical protein
MAQETLTTGTAIIVADATDHAPGATAQNNLGTRTDQIDLTGLASGAFRQSDKLDFGGGSAAWAPWWDVTAAIEPGSAPTLPADVRFWIGFSRSATAGQDNPGNLVGADGTYVGYGATAADAAEAIEQLVFIGSLPASADDDIFVAHIGRLFVPLRYGTLVIQDNLGAALEADAVEHSIRFTPIIRDIS